MLNYHYMGWYVGYVGNYSVFYHYGWSPRNLKFSRIPKPSEIVAAADNYYYSNYTSCFQWPGQASRVYVDAHKKVQIIYSVMGM